MREGIIYKVTNLINGKIYIGQTMRTFKQRKTEHKSKARNGSDFSLHRAFRKYGEDNFLWEIIDSSCNQEELSKKETYWIEFYNTFTGKRHHKGYNMTTGGEYNSHTEETKKKLSEINTGRIGHKHSDNTKKKLSEMRMKENNPFYGKTHTQETIDKIKEKLTGANNHNARAIIQLDLDGNFVAEYPTVTAGAKSVGAGNSNINKVCVGKSKTCKGFKWMYKEDYLALEK